MSEEKTSPKKLLEKSPLSGIAVPIAIVLVGALIIFGVTKMLSSGKNHRDLVEELNSKTFGNRWVAAYELSKYLASSRIPPQDVPWVVQNLVQVYEQSADARTRNFVVLALGTLKHPDVLPLLNKALDDADAQTQFSAVVTLGNLPPRSALAWDKLATLLQSTHDDGLKQAIILTVAAQRKDDGAQWLMPYLESPQRMLRYSAAMGLIYYGRLEANPTLQEMMNLSYENRAADELNGAQVEALKLNIITHAEKAEASHLLPLLKNTAENDSNIGVSTRAKQVVNLLKN